MRCFFNSLVITVAAILIPVHGAMAGQDCPEELKEITGIGGSWQTTPDFSGVGEISMVAEFTNTTGESVFFDDASIFRTFTISTTPNFFQFIPVEINAEPNGTILPGGTLTYDLTIHAGAFVASETGIAFKPFEHSVFGNLGPGRAELVSVIFSCTKGTGFQMDRVMTASFFDPDFLGQGINLEVLTDPMVIVKPEVRDKNINAASSVVKGNDLELVPGAVLMYWYTYDLFGFPMFAFGVGEFAGDTMIVEMLVDYDGAGPFFGPGWNPDDFSGTPFATVRITWTDCSHGVMTPVIDPAFDAANPGFVAHPMNLERITNALGVPCL